MRIDGGIRGVLVCGAALLCLVLFGTASARADFEGVGHFAGSLEPPVSPGVFPEDVQLGGTGGMAVNYTGNGGVPAGTVYAATKGPSSGTVRVAMYTPKVNSLTQELELEFSIGWEVTVQEEAYERCGPGLAVPTACQPRPEAAPGFIDVDIHQATGHVYVYNGTRTAGRKAIAEYNATGSEVIARFGEIAESGKSTAETPGQIHDSLISGGIAVNAAGAVYVYDNNSFGNDYHRLMKFRPKTPGVFTEYEYAGTGEDLGAGFENEGRRPWEPVADTAGNIYVAPEQNHVEMYDPANPGDPPVCDFEYTKGGITAITVDPATGESFFFSYKAPKRLSQLGPCNEATGEFEGGIVGETVVAPERDDLWGLAFNPVAKFEPSRAAGVIYGGAPNSVSSQGVGPGQPGRGSLGYIFAPTEENAPVVEAESVSEVSEVGARLQAVIDPKGSKTKYIFQYMTETAYQEAGESFEGSIEPTEAPLGGAFLPDPTGAQAAAVTVTGLVPDTAYRYQVVASSSCSKKEPAKVCEDSGEPESFHTYPAEAPGPHDDRFWELVSPAQKNGGQVLPAQPGLSSCGSEAECKPGETYEHFPMQSAPNGEAVAYEGTSFAPKTGVAQANQYIARRDSNLGWQSVNLTPSLLSQVRGYKALTESLSEALLVQLGPAFSAAAPPEYENLYTQPTSSPFAPGPLLTAAPPNRPASESGAFKLRFAGASADLSRVFFSANDVLTAEVPGIAPEPENGGAAKFNLYEWEAATGQLRLVNVFPGNATTKAGAAFGVETSLFGVPSAHPVSADGSRAFFSDEATGKVYVRENAALTKEIPGPGKFLSASSEGSKVLLDSGRLYDLETEAAIDLTGGKSGFQGIAGQSEDLSHIYFVDTAVLTGEELNSEGAKAQAGKFNLYAWSEEGPTTHFIGTLVASDNNASNLTRSQSWATMPSQRTAQASPNGRFLTFLSQAPLTDFDNTGPCESDHAGGFIEAPCPEVYAYDSQTEALTCASCNRSGATPLGLSALRLIKGSQELAQPRYLLNSGRLYFDSQDSLSQFDTNDGVEDVYEFEPEGTGGCTREDGCVTLISSGSDSFDANFLAVDASGANVFFTTRNRLNVADTDNWIDLYDAREGGGFPFETQLPQGPCQGEGCQLPAPAAPPAPPASLNPGGEGENVTRKPCKKGQVRKNGKCVKKHKPKKKGAKNKKRAATAKRGGGK